MQKLSGYRHQPDMVTHCKQHGFNKELIMYGLDDTSAHAAEEALHSRFKPKFGMSDSEATKRRVDKSNQANRKPIVCYSKIGDPLFTFNSVAQAERILKGIRGMSNPNISACLTGRRKSAGGYIWRYAHAE
jgi:hypothetical protein